MNGLTCPAPTYKLVYPATGLDVPLDLASVQDGTALDQIQVVVRTTNPAYVGDHSV